MARNDSDSDTLQETMDDEDETQCEEADEMIDANDNISDNSQRGQRYGHQQNKKKLKAEAIRKAKLDRKTIEERKASEHVPKVIKKDKRCTDSRSYVWKVFVIEEDNNNTAYLKCKLCLPRFFRLSYCGKSTSTMIYHIKSKHPNEHKKLENTGLLKNEEKIKTYMKKNNTLEAEW